MTATDAEQQATYEFFVQGVARIGTAFDTTIDLRVDEGDFSVVLAQAQDDADSFWQRPTERQQALSLLLVHIQEMVATSADDNLQVAAHGGYLRRTP